MHEFEKASNERNKDSKKIGVAEKIIPKLLRNMYALSQLSQILSKD
jgi:hypothetical protein